MSILFLNKTDHSFNRDHPTLSRIFACTNELGQEETLKKVSDLINRNQGEGNAVFSTGGFFSLNLASLHSRIKHIAIFDLSPAMQLFWKGVQEILQNRDLNLETARKAIFHFLKEKGYGHVQILSSEIQDGLSWLSSEERFKQIREIFLNGCFSFTNLDLGCPEQFRTFLHTQSNHKAIPLIVNISNIAECATGSGKSFDEKRYEAFRRSLQLIPTDSIVVNAVTHGFNLRAEQRVHEPAEPRIFVPVSLPTTPVTPASETAAMEFEYVALEPKSAPVERAPREFQYVAPEPKSAPANRRFNLAISLPFSDLTKRDIRSPT